MSFSALSNMFASICKVKVTDKGLLKEFEKIKREIDTINESRNRIMHSFWTADDNDNSKVSQMRFKADGFKGLKVISEYTSPNDIEKLADKIKLIAVELAAHAPART